MAAGTEPPSSKFSFTQTQSGSYDISNELLTRISRLFSRSIGAPATIELKLDNGAKLEAESVDLILSDSILEATLITELWVSASIYRDGLTHSARFYAKNGRLNDGITVYLQGRKEGVTALRGELEAFLRGGRQWHWPINYGENFFMFAFRLILAFLLSALLAWAIIRPMPISWFGDSPNSANFTFGCLAFCFFLFSDDIRRYAFPKVSFSIGKGKRQRDTRNKVLRYVGGTLIVGTVMAVAGNKLTDWLFSKG